MKRSLILLVLSISLCSCGTSMQNNPAAIQIGASVGGVVGSVLGENANGYHGWVVGNMLGTVAGVAIGDAVANSESRSQIRNREENNSYSYSQQQTDGDKLINPSENSQTFPVDIENIRFIDANHNHIIEAKEECKMVFDIYNCGNETIYNIYPRITLSNDNVGFSKPLVIDKINAGQVLRYTASVYGYSNLRNGTVDITISMCNQSGLNGQQHSFTLQTQP